MGMTDPVADMLTRIRNAGRARLKSVEIPSSKLKENIAAILKKEGYITDYKVAKDNRQGMLKITLKYGDDRKCVIEHIERVSRPGRRIYVKGDSVPKVINGYGIAILSTSRGLMVDREARKAKIGGEVLCNVW